MTSSSQESLLLSDDTFLALINQLPMMQDLTPENKENFGFPAAALQESQIVTLNSNSADEQMIPSAALPACSNWPGDHAFNVSFPVLENGSKGVNWTYSHIKDKLYVGKDVPCPVNFSSTLLDVKDVFIRAMALYKSSLDPVQRCLNHSMKEIEEGVFEAEHLVRCESKWATYAVTSSRYSVIVPYEIPAAGQLGISFIYKFKCFTSCSGGPNRRPMILVFTLEKGDRILGRQKVDLKICACPIRDKISDEKPPKEQFLPKEKPVKRKAETQNTIPSELPFKNVESNVDPDKCDLDTMTEMSKSDDGYYIMKVKTARCFKFLLQMKTFYEICGSRKMFPVEIQQFFNHMITSSSDEGDTV